MPHTPVWMYADSQPHRSLQNFYLVCKAPEKLLQLSRLISNECENHNASRLIIYFATCACVDYFYRVRLPHGPHASIPFLTVFVCVQILPSLIFPRVKLFSLHGRLQSAARTKALMSFASFHATPSAPAVLLTTDVAARGLDIPDVDVVLQFDPPSDPKSFSHRCGRTARAGKSGRATVLLTGEEIDYVGRSFHCYYHEKHRSIISFLSAISICSDFMAVRKIPLKQRPYLTDSATESDSAAASSEGINEPKISLDPAVQKTLVLIRKKVLSDRALHDQVSIVAHISPLTMSNLVWNHEPLISSPVRFRLQGAEAFVSFIKAYSKHEAAYIFRIKKLDLIGVAQSFGLLRLPRMPELKDMPREGWEDAEVDVSLVLASASFHRSTFQWDTYTYSDDAREKKRLQDLENREKASAENQRNKAERLAKKKANVSWSSQTFKKEVRDQRKEKKVKRKKWIKSQQPEPSSSALAVPRKRGLEADDEDEEDEDDWAELAREERMAKKVKKGEITQLEFDGEFAS